jgi:hypothetical protein
MWRRAKKYLFRASFLVPLIVAAFSSIETAGRTAYAIATFEGSKYSHLEKLEPSDQIELRREIQRHLSDHFTYVPLEDIEWHDEDTLAYSKNSGTMQNQCEGARLHIWVPLRFKFPIIGEKVVEWCWKPRIKAA